MPFGIERRENMSNQKHRPRHPQRMHAGALGPLIEGYADHLARLRHTQLTIGNAVDSARHLAAWLARAGIALCDVDEAAVARFARHRCQCGGNRHCERLSAKYVRRARRFVRFVAARGAVRATAPAQAPQPVDERVVAFQDWLRQHRGISALTILRYGAMVMRLLPALGAEPGGYDAAGIRRVIVAECRSCSLAYVKTMTTALRGYLRFLAARGECTVGLDHAVPSVPQWRLSALPRYLPEAEVEQLIGSCDLAASAGLRDRAILLLLARLGLRAGDILAMRLDDVDWAAAALRVRGKGRRETRLPLPQDAGDALLAYLEHARPRVQCDQVFLRSYAPHRTMMRPSSISSIVCKALDRAGITDGHRPRAPVFCAIPRPPPCCVGGASLDPIGAVLRHRSADTTAHYAKVDVVTLRQIAQPWPGAV